MENLNLIYVLQKEHACQKKLSNDVSKIPIPLDNNEIRDYVKRNYVELS